MAKFIGTSADLLNKHQAIPSARHQRTLQDHGYGLVYRCVSVYFPSFRRLQPAHRGRAQAE